MRKLTAWALLAFAMSQCAVADGPRYTAEVHLYRIHGTPIHIYGHNGLDVDVNSQLEGTLDSLITMAFEEVHLTEVFKFIGEIYGILFQIDDGLVAPKGQNAAVFLSAGRVEYIDVKKVPVRQTLDILLAPLGLDYVVTADYVRIVKASGKSPSDSARRQMMSRFDPGSQWSLVNSGSMRVGRSLVQFSKGARPIIGVIDGVENLANPEVIVMAGQQGKIEMGGEIPFLIPVPDSTGGYQLRTTQVFAGLAIGFLFTPNDPDAVECNFDLTYRYVRERQATRGVDLPVGEPIIETINTNEKLKVTLDQPIAMLTRAGENDDIILALLKVTQLPEPQPESQNKAGAELPQYTVDMKMLHLHGKPEWSFWTRGYDLDYTYGDGAGRVFGPVALDAPLDIDRLGAQLGFPGTAQKDVTFIAAPRVTSYLDHKALSERGITSLYKLILMNRNQTVPNTITPNTDAPKAPANISEQWNAVYDSLALQPKKLGMEDVAGKATIIAADLLTNEAGDIVAAAPGKGFGTMAVLEGRSGESPGVYRLDQTIVLREALRVKRDDPLIAHTQFNCDYEIKDGSGTAFLLPVSDEEYMVIVSEFDLVKE